MAKFDSLQDHEFRRDEWAAMEQGDMNTQPAPDAGEWSVLNTSGVVQDVDGEPVAAARSYQIATQIVADHNAVGLLADMLRLALANSSHAQDCKSRASILKSGIDAREQCTCWRREVDAALAAARRRS